MTTINAIAANVSAGIQPLKTNACMVGDRSVGKTLAPTEMDALLDEWNRISNNMLPRVLL